MTLPIFQVIRVIERFEAGADHLAIEEFTKTRVVGDKLVRSPSVDIISGVPIEQSEYLYVVKTEE